MAAGNDVKTSRTWVTPVTAEKTLRCHNMGN
jgi:hypothetical protein